MKNALMAMLMVVLALAATGCNPYVNIPAQMGDMAQHNPNLATVRNIVTPALRAAIDEMPPQGQVVIVLPEGSTPLTYQYVTSALGPRAVSVSDAPEGDLPVVEARQVRVRSWQGEVDIVRPAVVRRDADRELVTVTMQFDPINQWFSKTQRVWRMNVEDAVVLSRAADMDEAQLQEQAVESEVAPQEQPEEEQPEEVQVHE